MKNVFGSRNMLSLAIPGSRQRTATFNTPVYTLRDDIASEDFITQYTKQDVLSGIYEPGGAKFGKVEPLAYLPREGFEDAFCRAPRLSLFQMARRHFFNVDKNNGIAFSPGVDPGSKSVIGTLKKSPSLMDMDTTLRPRFRLSQTFSFAGDVLNIGLGKIVAIETSDQNLRFWHRCRYWRRFPSQSWPVRFLRLVFSQLSRRLSAVC